MIVWNKVTWYSKALTILVGVATLAVSYYAWWEYREIDRLSKDVERVYMSLSDQASIYLAANSTKDWQMYRNEKYGFEFKYPNDWELSSDDAVIVSSENLWHKVIITNKKTSTQLSVSIYENHTPPAYIYDGVKESVILNNKAATAYIFPAGYECAHENDGGTVSRSEDCSWFVVPVKRGESEYRIQFAKNAQEISDSYRQILSTFKFTK